MKKINKHEQISYAFYPKKLPQLMILLIVLAFIFAMPVYGGDSESQFDPDRAGVLQITAKDEESGKTEEGAEISVYKVADIEQADNEYRITCTEAFSDLQSDIDAAGEFDRTLGEKAEVIREEADPQISYSGKTDENGYLEITGINVGVYLIVQTNTVGSFQPFSPFLVSMPVLDEDGICQYNVDTFPKMDVREITETPQPTATVTAAPGSSGSQQAADSSFLPQTGQIWWPVPVLLSIGVLFLVLGILRIRKA